MFFAEQTGKHNYFTHCYCRGKLFCIFRLAEQGKQALGD